MQAMLARAWPNKHKRGGARIFYAKARKGVEDGEEQEEEQKEEVGDVEEEVKT